MSEFQAAAPDVILVGAGIMSATLGVFLKELDPDLRIVLFETLEGAALESSDAWNNAGTAMPRCANSTTRLSGPTAASTFPRRSRSTSSSICRGSCGLI